MFYQPGTEAVDALSPNISHAGACKTVGTLVIPKSSYFWLLLCEDGKHWNAFVCDWVTLPKFKNLFIKGKAKNQVFVSKDFY